MNLFDGAISEFSATKDELINELYFLMKMDTVVALLAFNRATGDIISVVQVFDEPSLPINYGASLIGLRSWWSSRSVPISREGIKRVLHFTNELTPTALLLASKGLSLTDHYWVKHVTDESRWEEVNFFTNEFSDDIGNLLLSTRTIEDSKDISKLSPNSSVVGEMKKKWIINDNKRSLLKVNMNDYSQQCVNEVIASKLHKTSGFSNYVNYDLIDVKLEGTTTVGCICDAFTSEELEFISGYALVQMPSIPNDVSEYEFMIRQAVKFGLSEIEVRNQLEYQIATDFLLTNTDRHYNNFGFLRNKDSIKLTGMAPIFDTGNSLFYKSERIPIEEYLLEIEITSFCKKEVDLLKYIKIKDFSWYDKLGSFDSVVYDELSKCIGIPDERRTRIAESFKKKYHLFGKFIEGEKLWIPAKYRR